MKSAMTFVIVFILIASLLTIVSCNRNTGKNVGGCDTWGKVKTIDTSVSGKGI